MDKVEDIEEEFANKLEQHEKDMQTSFKESEETIKRLEKKICAKAMINQLLNVQ